MEGDKGQARPDRAMTAQNVAADSESDSGTRHSAGDGSALFGGLGGGGAGNRAVQAAPAHTSPPVPATSDQVPSLVTDRWLAGVWVHKGDGCATDNILRFDPGGAFGSFGAEGSWTLSGDRLTTISREVEMGEPDSVPGPPQTETDRVVYLGVSEMALNGVKLTRCR